MSKLEDQANRSTLTTSNTNRPTQQPSASSSGSRGGKLGAAVERPATTTSTAPARSERTLDADFKALQEGRPQDVRQWKEIAQTAIRLNAAGDRDAQETSRAIVQTYGDQLKDYIDAEDPDWWDRNYVEPEKSFKDKSLGVIGDALRWTDQWGASARSSLAGLESALTDDGVSFGDGLRHAVRQGTRAIDVTRALPGDGLSGYLENSDDTTIIRTSDGRAKLLDQDGDGSLNLRESLGAEVNAGGRWLTAVDMLGTIVFDPTTYISLGGSQMAKLGMTAAEEAAEAMGQKAVAKTMNKTIRREGWQALSKEQQTLYQSFIRKSADDAVAQGGKRVKAPASKIAADQTAAVQLGGRSGIKLGGVTVRPYGKLGAAVEDGRAALSRRLLTGDGKLSKAITALKPRARIAALYGADVADDLGHLLSATRDPEKIAEIATRMGTDLNRKGLVRQSIAEMGDELEWRKTIDSALSNPDNYDTVAGSVGPAMRDMLDTLVEVREELTEATLRGQGYQADEMGEMLSGAIDMPETMREVSSYIPRVISGAVRSDSTFMQQMKNLGPQADQLEPSFGEGIDQLTERFMKERTIVPETDSILDTNRQVQAAFKAAGVKVPGDLFESHIPAAMAVRSKSAFEAAFEVDLLDGLVKLDLGDGVPMGVRAVKSGDGKLSADKVAKGKLLEAGVEPADYRPVVLENGAVYRIHNDIADEMESMQRVFKNPGEINKIGQFFDKFNNVWAMSATVSLLNPAFHVRNELGNLVMTYLGGLRNPARFAEAAGLQRQYRLINQQMRHSGESFEAAAKAVGLDAADTNILAKARELGVLGDSRALDITRERAGKANAPTKPGLLNKLNPASSESIINKPGIMAGETIEGNARLALYLDQIGKGASPKAAAMHTKKFLFDYGDLTRFESGALRRVSRFYTFTRKNIGLQMYAMSRHPGQLANTEEVVRGLIELATDPLNPDAPGAEGEAPPWMNNPLMRSIAGDNAALSVDTPLASAAELVELGPAVVKLFQEDGPLQTEDDKAELIAKVDGLFAGWGVSALDWWQEQESGRDSFTGRPLGDELRDHWLFRATETFFPGASRLERYGAHAGLTRDGDAQRPAGLFVANALLGLQTQPLNDDTDSSERYVLMKTVEEAMDAMRDEGVEIPTMDELREMGELAAKDRVAHALLYSWEQDEETGELRWSDSVYDDRLLNTIPKDVRQALNLPEPGTGVGSSRGARPEGVDLSGFDLQQAIDAIETFRGQPLTDDEKRQVVLASPWAPNNSILEGMGIEPWRDTNRFIAGEEPLTYEEQLAEAEAELAVLANAAGLDSSSFSEYLPRLPEFQRMLHEAEAAGVAGRDLHEYILRAKDEGGGGVLSRDDKAAINQLLGYGRTDGPVPLTTERWPEFTEDDARKLQVKAWEAEQEYILFSQLYGLGRPTAEQIQAYVVNDVMTVGEARLVGLDPLKGAPNRKDARSDAEKQRAASGKLTAAMRGVRSGPNG